MAFLQWSELSYQWLLWLCWQTGKYLFCWNLQIECPWLANILISPPSSIKTVLVAADRWFDIPDKWTAVVSGSFLTTCSFTRCVLPTVDCVHRWPHLFLTPHNFFNIKTIFAPHPQQRNWGLLQRLEVALLRQKLLAAPVVAFCGASVRIASTAAPPCFCQSNISTNTVVPFLPHWQLLVIKNLKKSETL